MLKQSNNVTHYDELLAERFAKSLYFNRRDFILVLLVGLLGIVLTACSVVEDKQDRVPAIALAPAAGGPNTQVVVRGENFPAGMAVMLRLGPPDVGATPFSYATGAADGQGRFSLIFSVPDNWPDGTAIMESTLTVIVLNDDGSVKATAPFLFEGGAAVSLPPVVVSEVMTPDPTLIANEEAIVNAVKNYLTQSGESAQVAVAVELIEGEFARVGVVPLESSDQGNLMGYLKLVDGVWEVLVVGRDFDSDQLLELGIPAMVLPEEMLAPEG